MIDACGIHPHCVSREREKSTKDLVGGLSTAQLHNATPSRDQDQRGFIYKDFSTSVLCLTVLFIHLYFNSPACRNDRCSRDSIITLM